MPTTEDAVGMEKRMLSTESHRLKKLQHKRRAHCDSIYVNPYKVLGRRWMAPGEL